MDDVRPGLTQKFTQVGKVPLDREPFAELLGHQRLTVAHANDFTSFHPLHVGCVGIRDLTASHNGCLKHGPYPARNFGNNASIPPQSTLLASSLAWSSISRCYNASFSRKRAIASD
jgi:hypothetical protein